MCVASRLRTKWAKLSFTVRAAARQHADESGGLLGDCHTRSYHRSTITSGRRRRCAGQCRVSSACDVYWMHMDTSCARTPRACRAESAVVQCIRTCAVGPRSRPGACRTCYGRGPNAQMRLRCTTAVSALHAAGVLAEDVSKYIKTAYGDAASAAAPSLCYFERPAPARITAQQ